MIKIIQIENFCSDNAVWLLPLMILILQFIFKLVISEKTKFNKLWESLLQTPVDIGFLSISIFASSIILSPSTGKFMIFIVLIAIIAIIISVWRYSPPELSLRCIIKSSLLMVFNYSISIIILAIIINNI